MNTNPEESKICKCNVQEYERIIVFKNENDGTYTDILILDGLPKEILSKIVL
ncbi:hypothetical protein P2W68_07435 [Chryseobacterium arthrosphaerae]|uniref:hypothetical protein n=1 Tax=Chryseobacterium arthrosphaerae TaxID=651561 RepID=UPI0023E27C67|nr:hypothetical protein [Chryseobacterium arthrosphaerae]WES99441.1 hypothetical protein P2W68_07435 [Chryseobacterium arthrosphaerae]